MKYKDPITGQFKEIYINKLNDYSTNEQKIGNWIDGKSLYRKCLQINKEQLFVGSHSYNHNISNMDIAVAVKGFVSRAVIGITNLIPWNNTNEKWRIDINDIDRANIGLYLGENVVNNCNYIILIIEYTKTTD